jgi:hypothetical protein
LEQAEQAFGRVSAHPPLIVYSAPQGGTRDPRTAFEILKAASEGAAERQRQFGADQSDGIQNIRLLAESIKLHQRVNFGLRITLKELSILSKQATQDELATASPQTRRRMSFHGPKSARVPQ